MFKGKEAEKQASNVSCDASKENAWHDTDYFYYS